MNPLKNKQTKNILLILIITAILLILPYFFRMFLGNESVITPESYHNIRLFEEVNGFKFYDSIEQRPIPFNVIYMFPLTGNEFGLVKLIPFLLGLLSVFLMYLILKKHNIDEKHITATLALLIFSPIFLYIFIGFNFYSVILFLTLLAFFCLINEQRVLATALFVLIPFIDFYGGLLTFIFLAIYFILPKCFC